MAEGLARAGFDLDLAHGEARESAFVNALTRCHVEHKSDGRAPETGNVAIEFETRRVGGVVPSGIGVTTADWYAIEVQDDTWLVIRTSWLKRLVAIAQRNGRVKWGGDQNRFHNALIPVQWIVSGVPMNVPKAP